MFKNEPGQPQARQEIARPAGISARKNPIITCSKAMHNEFLMKAYLAGRR
jgi:hypothetical protein